MPALQSAFGFVALAAIAWIISENRRQIAWRTVIAGAALQLLLALALLKLALAKRFFLSLNEVLSGLETAPRLVGVRCWGRRRAAVRRIPSGSEFRAGVPRAAADPGGERIVLVVVLL